MTFIEEFHVSPPQTRPRDPRDAPIFFGEGLFDSTNLQMRRRKTKKWAKIVIPCPNCGCGCDVELGDSDEEEISSVSSDSDPEPEPVRKKPRLDDRSRRSSANSEPDPAPEPALEPKIEPKEEPPSQTNIHNFFSQYTSFRYDSSQPVMSEFYRMCNTTDFGKFNSSQQQARNEIRDALTLDFNVLYGTDVNDIASWQSLCRVLQFDTIPDDLEECRKLVDATFVNIIDLIDTKLTGDPVMHFDSEKALSVYTRQTGKIFPRDNVHAGGLLKFLLRKIYKPTAATRDDPAPRFRKYGL